MAVVYEAEELNDAAGSFLPRPKQQEAEQFDRHAGVGETSSGLYLFPNLVDMSKADKNEVTLPEHLKKALPK
jgi:creatinine amidohydrolase/Fe(II)-dependent formamide hydrolase-like protein